MTQQTTAQETKIRRYSMSRDEWECGGSYTCGRCGRAHRHVVEVNGVTYGKVCAVHVMKEQGIIEPRYPAPVFDGEVTPYAISRIVNPMIRQKAVRNYYRALYARLNNFTLPQITVLTMYNSVEELKRRAEGAAEHCPHLNEDWAVTLEIKEMLELGLTY